jgi:hypothetical protein
VAGAVELLVLGVPLHAAATAAAAAAACVCVVQILPWQIPVRHPCPQGFTAATAVAAFAAGAGGSAATGVAG